MDIVPFAEGIARVACGGVLVVTALAKWRVGSGRFAAAILGYQLLPAGFVAPLSRAIPVLELALGAALLAGVLVQAAAAAAAALLIVFSARSRSRSRAGKTTPADALAQAVGYRAVCSCATASSSLCSWRFTSWGCEMTRRSSVLRNVAMRRRSLLAGGGAALGVLGAQFVGLLPELTLASAAAPAGALRARELFGYDATRVYQALAAHPTSGPLRAFLSFQGFREDSARATALVMEDEGGNELGRSASSSWSDETGRSARLIEHERAGDHWASAALWNDGNPAALSIYAPRDGHVAKIGTVSSVGRTVTIVDEQGERHSLALPPKAKATKMKAGSPASVGADPICSLRQTVTTVVCGLACELVFFVVCTVLLTLDGLPGLACFLVSFGVCYVTCSTVSSVICSLVC